MNKRGFTLVELLVVISIIALLLSILMPSLQKARSQARKIVCQAQMKQMATAWTAYAVDNDGKMATAVFQGTDPWWEGYWPYRFEGYLHNLSPDKYHIGVEQWKDTALYCPAAINSEPPFVYYEAITYALNGFLGGAFDKNGNNIIRSGPYDVEEVTSYKIANIQNPSERMTWIDAGYNGRALLDCAAPNFYVEYASIRHQGIVNYIFVDSHAESGLPIRNDELYLLLTGKRIP